MNNFAFLFGASLLLASAAHAEGFYAGGSFGFGNATLVSDSQFDDSDDNLFMLKGIGGYRVNKFVAVESTIIGAANDDYDYDSDGDVDVAFGALTGSVLGIIPVTEAFELYAKVGAYFGESEVDDDFFFFDDNGEDESGMMWGAGILISFGSREQFTIRVDYEQFDTDVLDDFWAVGGGFQYNFGRN